MLTDTDRFRCPANVAARVIDGEAILIHLETGRYFSADGLGAIVWRLADAGMAVGHIAASIAETFDVSPDRAREDVARFMEELRREELLVTEPDTTTASVPDIVAEFGRVAYSSPTLHAYRDMADLLALDPPMPSMQPRA